MSRNLSKNSDGARDFLDSTRIRESYQSITFSALWTPPSGNANAPIECVCRIQQAHIGGNMNSRSLIFRFGVLAVLALTFAFGSRTMPAQSPDSEEVSNLLAQAKSHAVQAEDDAATLDSYAHSKLSWKSHDAKLNQIREHVNALGKVSKELVDNRSTGSPWQQKAVDQIDPLLREMANILTVTIQHLNENPTRVHMPEYREYAHANYEVANKLAGMVRDFVEYDEAHSRAESLEARLELSEPEKAE